MTSKGIRRGERDQITIWAKPLRVSQKPVQPIP